MYQPKNKGDLWPRDCGASAEALSKPCLYWKSKVSHWKDVGRPLGRLSGRAGPFLVPKPGGPKAMVHILQKVPLFSMLVTASRGHSLLEVILYLFSLIYLFIFNTSGTFYENQCVVQCAVKMTRNAKKEIEDNVSGKIHMSLHSIHFYLLLTETITWSYSTLHTSSYSVNSDL